MSSLRPNPSTNWEPIPLDPSGQFTAWVWFRPTSNPTGLVFTLPPNLFSVTEVASRLTLRHLAFLIGLDPQLIQYWSLAGMSFDSLGGTSPLFDQCFPAPPAGTNVEIAVWVSSPPMMPSNWPSAPAAESSVPFSIEGQKAVLSHGGSDQQLFDAIDNCWNGVIQLEVKVNSLRKELGGSIGRMNSLNRDLTSHERLSCNSSDLQDWNDARRWLRESVTMLSKSVKEIDVGTTSGAGKKNQFEEIYRNHVVPRIPFSGMMETIHEYEGYRKILQYVAATAQASLNKAGRGAETRANSVLQRIATKVRARKK